MADDKLDWEALFAAQDARKKAQQADDEDFARRQAAYKKALQLGQEDLAMSQALDNARAEELARAYALAEDEYLLGVAPTNINPFFQLAIQGGKHRGMFGSLPTGPAKSVDIGGGESIDTAGYRTKQFGNSPFLANSIPEFEERRIRGEFGARAYVPDETDISKQQQLRPVLADPYLATSEILSHEAGHLTTDEFVRSRLEDLLPLIEERPWGEYSDQPIGEAISEYLVELFEPVGMSEQMTDTAVTDAERDSVQRYMMGDRSDSLLLTPGMRQMLDSLISYTQEKTEDTQKFSTGGLASFGGAMRGYYA